MLIMCFRKKWTRINLRGKESRCVVFLRDPAKKPHALKLETTTFGTVLTITTARANATLDVCHTAY